MNRDRIEGDNRVILGFFLNEASTSTCEQNVSSCEALITIPYSADAIKFFFIIAYQEVVSLSFKLIIYPKFIDD